MKRLSTLMGSLLGLLALAMFVVAIVFVFSGFQRHVEPSASALQSPIGTPARTPGPPKSNYPVSNGRPVELPGANAWPSPTDLPDRGVRIGSPNKPSISWADAAIEHLYNPALDGDLLVSDATVPAGTAVVAINLKTGRISQLSQVRGQSVEEPHVSGRYVAWIESVPGSDPTARQLHVFDLTQSRESVVGQPRLPYQLDLKNDIMVWQDYRGQRWGIYGYDLSATQEFTIAVDSTNTLSAPRICSKAWVIFLQNIQQGGDGTADLHARNLATGEDILIGQIPLVQDSTAGDQHACDGNRVAWVSVQTQAAGPIYKQHIYDLNSRSDRVLDIQIKTLPAVRLNGDVLLSSVGYDLAKDVPFKATPSISPEQFRIGSAPLLSRDRVAWIVNETDGTQGIYTAPITRR
jgi:hypothetical protein